MKYELQPNDCEELARYIGAETHRKGDELFFKWCPECKGGGRDKDTFSINTKTGAFSCFRASCGYKGFFTELARDVGYPIQNDEPKQYKKLPQKQIETKPEAIEFLKSRCISEETAKRYHITVQSAAKHILVFPFYHNGELVSVKYRNTRHKKGDNGPKEWFEKDTMPVLFGMQECEGFQQVIITEGQLDSLSLAECGIQNAISVPNGAQGFAQWVRNCYDWLSKFQKIIVFGDYEKGKMTLVDKLMERFQAKFYTVRPADYLGEKDANDILRNYGKDAVIKAVQNAEPVMVTAVKDLSTVRMVSPEDLPKISTGIRQLDRTIGGLMMGQVVLLTGKRGNGKSTLMSQLVVEALEQGESVFVYSGELADFHFKHWLDCQLAGKSNMIRTVNQYGDEVYSIKHDAEDRITKWYAGRAYIYDNTFVPAEGEKDTLITTVEKMVRQCSTRLVCIDNLMTAMDGSGDDLYTEQSNFVGRLKKLAMALQVCIVLVAHPRKNGGGGDYFDNDAVAGSGDITNKVDVVLSYRREGGDSSVGFLEVSKNRLFGKYRKIQLIYSSASKRIQEDEHEKQYSWTTATESRGEELPF